MKLAKQAEFDRRMCNRSLYYLCKEVLGYKDMVPHVHGEICDFATNPKYGRLRQGTLPRSWFKTWVWTVGKSIWLTLPDDEGLWKDVYMAKGQDVRILIASNVIDNAAKMINKIKSEWESNERLKAAYPELIPRYNKTRWSDHCAQVNRKIKAQEGTYNAVGAGGSVISQHFDHIIEDDLIYAKKDDFSGEELMPSQEDIDKAIGWHKLVQSLFVNPKTSTLDNVGTRWAPHDLIRYIRDNEPDYSCFELAATRDAQWPVVDDTDCLWPERFSKDALEKIRNAQGNRLFETQYLNRPRAGEDVVFDSSYLNIHDNLDEFPLGLKYVTMVDLATWKDKKRICNNVVLTGARDEKNHLWISRVDAGRYNPTEVIELIKEHVRQFESNVYIEEVAYQASLRHFARKDMENTGFIYNINSLPVENKANAKENRIQGLQPEVRQGFVHILRGMKGLRQEMEDYPYGATKDILDILGYLRHYARPARKTIEKPKISPFSLEAILKEVTTNRLHGLPFDVQLGRANI